MGRPRCGAGRAGASKWSDHAPRPAGPGAAAHRPDSGRLTYEDIVTIIVTVVMMTLSPCPAVGAA